MTKLSTAPASNTAPAIKIIKMDETQMERFKSLLDGFQDLNPPAPKTPIKAV